MYGIHNFISVCLCIWFGRQFRGFFFLKREILAVAVLLTWVPSTLIPLPAPKHIYFFFHRNIIFFTFQAASCFCFRFSVVAELLFPVIMYLSSTASIRQEYRENQQMYITYISTAPTKQCLEFDTWLHWCVVINAFLIADRNDWFLTFMLDLEPAEVNGSPRRLHPKSIRSTTHKKQWQLFLSQPLWLVHWVKRQTGTPGNRFYKFYDTKWEPLIIRYKPKDNDEVQSRYIFFFMTF